MDVIVVSNRAELDARGAEILLGWIRKRPSGLVVPALGNSPIGIYRLLAAARVEGRLDASGLRAAQLDEYLGIGRDDLRTLRSWLERDFLGPLGIGADRVIGLLSDTDDIAAACDAYAAAVRGAGGIDVSILGLGPNGHLGFNEPPSVADAPTRAVDLAPGSIASGAAYFGTVDRVPRRALTCGMDLLLSARRTLLVVSGAHKREILAKVLKGSITGDVPGSLLRTIDGVTLLADRDALPTGDGSAES
jgi:glucosamine-6-phosphate deaminase